MVNLRGSKETDMTKAPNKPAAETHAPKTKMDTQSGQERAAEPVRPAQEERKDAVKRQFITADKKADPTPEEIAEATIIRSVRGW